MSKSNKNHEDNKSYPTNKITGDRRAPKSKDRYQDPLWYAENTEAIRNMASFPWNEVVGSSLISDGSDKVRDAIPGALIVSWKPSFGCYQPGDSTNSLTRAANMFYNYFAQAFTAPFSEYEAPDLFMSCIAAAGVFTAMEDIRRVMGQMHYFLQLNSYHGRHIIEALGYDYDDWTRNLANARTEFNIRVSQINKTIVCPKKLSIVERWNFLASQIFCDTSSPDYSTAIVYVQRAFPQFNGTVGKNGTALIWAEKPTTNAANTAPVYKKLTVSEAFAFVDALINSLKGSDVQQMFGALRRVYSDADFWQLSEITADYLTPVVRNDVVSASLHNMNWYTDLGSADKGTVIAFMPAGEASDGSASRNVIMYQTAAGEIISQTCYMVKKATADVMSENDMYTFLRTQVAQKAFVFDLYDHLVTPENVLDVTVNKAYPVKETNWPGDTSYALFRLGTRCEVITNLECLTYAGTNGTPTLNTIGAYFLANKEDVPSGFSFDGGLNMDEFQQLTHVDSHPLIPVMRFVPAAGFSVYTHDGYIGEIDRYTMLSQDAITTLNNRTLWKLMQMPASTKRV